MVKVGVTVAAFWHGSGVVTIEHAAMLLVGAVGAFFIDRNLRRITDAIHKLERRLSNLEAQRKDHHD